MCHTHWIKTSHLLCLWKKKKMKLWFCKSGLRGKFKSQQKPLSSRFCKKDTLECKFFLLPFLFLSSFFFNLIFCCVSDNKDRSWRCWGLEERKPSWWRSVERAGRSYLCCSVYQLLLFQLLITWCQSISVKAPDEEQQQRTVSSVLISFSPFLFLTKKNMALFTGAEMSQ